MPRWDRRFDELLAFLPIFEASGFTFGSLPPPAPGSLVYPVLAPELIDFAERLSRTGFLLPFDWTSWAGEAQKYVNDPARIPSASLTTLRKLLTTHVRADRFGGAHLIDLAEKGLLTAVLRRLVDLREGR